MIVLAAAAAVAYATIPSAGGVIHGCYHQKSGNLRVIDADAGAACLASEAPLDWNRTGPPGPTGASGPSDAYVASNAGMHLDDVDTTLVSITLPAGAYSVVAKANFYDDPFDSDTGDKVVHCRLLAGTTEIDYVDARISSFAKENDNDEILTFIGAAAAGGTITLVCNGGGVVSEDTKLLATKVGTLHT